MLLGTWIKKVKISDVDKWKPLKYPKLECSTKDALTSTLVILLGIITKKAYLLF